MKSVQRAGSFFQNVQASRIATTESNIHTLIVLLRNNGCSFDYWMSVSSCIIIWTDSTSEQLLTVNSVICSQAATTAGTIQPTWWPPNKMLNVYQLLHKRGLRAPPRLHIKHARGSKTQGNISLVPRRIFTIWRKIRLVNGDPPIPFWFRCARMLVHCSILI